MKNEKIADLIQYYTSENSLLLVMFAAADNEKDRRDILHDIGINNHYICELTREMLSA